MGSKAVTAMHFDQTYQIVDAATRQILPAHPHPHLPYCPVQSSAKIPPWLRDPSRPKRHNHNHHKTTTKNRQKTTSEPPLLLFSATKVERETHGHLELHLLINPPLPYHLTSPPTRKNIHPTRRLYAGPTTRHNGLLRQVRNAPGAHRRYPQRSRSLQPRDDDGVPGLCRSAMRGQDIRLLCKPCAFEAVGSALCYFVATLWRGINLSVGRTFFYMMNKIFISTRFLLPENPGRNLFFT